MPHIHEKIDFVVETFVVYKNKVLLRLHDKYKIWLSIGGHVELHEDPNEAAAREVKEEVGLDVKIVPAFPVPTFSSDDVKELIPPRGVNRHHINPTHEHVAHIYFAKATSDKVIPEKENDVWKWVTKEELDGMDIRPSIKYYAEMALEELGK
jgi:8-oxo-dGTP pyrophosphatase MutT (NUDIX family)